MRWNELDLEAATWEIPRERCKSERAHMIHLSPMALDVLAKIPRTESPLVFPASRQMVPGRENPISGFNAGKRKCDALAPVDNWRLHDLRRTAASGMAALRVQPHVLEKLLNHSSGIISGVAATYNKYQYLEEREAALDCWSRHLESILGLADSSNVVELNQPATVS